MPRGSLGGDVDAYRRRVVAEGDVHVGLHHPAVHVGRAAGDDFLCVDDVDARQAGVRAADVGPSGHPERVSGSAERLRAIRHPLRVSGVNDQRAGERDTQCDANGGSHDQ